ncbi:hypothetical protein ID866_10362 [Astraeus odoratus]|nr:hypothetical protein ID866_10362 [Astraeus odoratus]
MYIMYISTSAFSFFLLALISVHASPHHLGVGLYNNQIGKRDNTVFVHNEGWYYIAPVVTSSLDAFNLIVDTGSSYTWVGARMEHQYAEGYASYPTSQIINLSYGGGMVLLRAQTYQDLIVLDDLTINPQGIGIPTKLEGFPPGFDGIMGLGPSRAGAYYSEDGKIIPTVVDNLYSQGAIGSPLLGVFLWPRSISNVCGPGGILSFGSIDTSVLTSDVKYVHVTQTPPASHFWGVDASIAYGSMPILGLTPGILDTGSCGISVPSDTFMTYQAATGAAIDFFDLNKRLTITQEQYRNLQSLSIFIGDQSYDLSPNAQIYPRSSSSEQIYLVIKSLASEASLGFKLGSPFFQRYYVVFNSANSEIGLASHVYTQSASN